MTTAEGAFSAPQKSVPWWLVLMEGVALIILGALFLANPARTTGIVVQVIGIYWIISGILSLVSMFVDHSAWGWKLIIGILGIVAGILVLQHPLWSPVVIGTTLIIILGIWGLMAGIMQLIMAFQGGGWGVGILGVISIILGIILLTNVWVATFSLPWVLGIFGIIGGIVAIIQAFRMRS